MAGWGLMTTAAEATEIQPTEFVTVKVNVPAGNPVTVVLVPEPDVVVPPGVRVRVQVPLDGNPDNTTLPVSSVHVGWVLAPTTGAEGTAG